MREEFAGVREEVYATAVLAEDLHARGGSGHRRDHLLERRGDGVHRVAAGGVRQRCAPDALQAQQFLQLCQAAQYLCMLPLSTTINSNSINLQNSKKRKKSII